ncbi:hypothetical protein ABZ769_31990 [Streptomyces olivoreticuli]
METVLTSVIAVLGTLAGTGAAYALQQRAAARSERAARQEELRRDRQEAVRALVRALTAHRRNLYTRWKLTCQEAAPGRQEEARWESWSSRSAVSDARVALRMVTGDAELLHRADLAIGCSYALGDVDGTTTQAVMDERGDLARTAHDEFVAAAAAYVNGV